MIIEELLYKIILNEKIVYILISSPIIFIAIIFIIARIMYIIDAFDMLKTPYRRPKFDKWRNSNIKYSLIFIGRIIMLLLEGFIAYESIEIFCKYMGWIFETKETVLIALITFLSFTICELVIFIKLKGVLRNYSL